MTSTTTIEDKVRGTVEKVLGITTSKDDLVKYITKAVYEILQAPLPEKLTAEEMKEATTLNGGHLASCFCHGCRNSKIITRLLDHIQLQSRLLEVTLTDSGYLIGYQEGIDSVKEIVLKFEDEFRSDNVGPSRCVSCNCSWKEGHKDTCPIGQYIEKFKS